MSPTEYVTILRERGMEGVLHAYRSYLASC